jgi:hypothetical protein
VRAARPAIILVAATAAGFVLAACGGGSGSGGGSPAGHEVSSPGPQTETAAPGSTQADVPSPSSTRYGTARLTGGCLLGIYDQGQNEFYQLLGLAHGSDITTGETIAEAYQVTLADSPTAGAATVTGFTVAVYLDGKKLASTTEHLRAGKLIPPGQVATFTEYPWGTSSARQGLAVGPFAARGDPPANLAATCRLLRVDAR